MHGCNFLPKRPVFFCFLAMLFFSVTSSANPQEVLGSLSNFSFDFDLGASPGTDLANASGSYVVGQGSNGFNFATDSVTVSLDGGRFVQTLPPGSMLPISGGRRYSSTGSGIRLLRVMNNGTFSLQIRAADLSGMSSIALGSFALLVGDDRFEITPNSLPVAKITAPSSIVVGNAAILSAANSSDFNFDNLSFSWSILSKPVSSSAVLSSTGAAASIVPDLAGLYTIKLQVTDGISDGISTVHTFRATGGPVLPPGPPTPSNGFVALSSNFSEYLLGDVATILVDQLVPENVPDFEYFYRATLNNIPVTLVTIPNGGGDKQFISDPLTVDGTNVFRVDLYVQDAKLAKQFGDSITFYQSDIAKIDAALARETDPEIIADLQAQKVQDQQLLAKAQIELEKNRTKVGAPTALTFSVN